MNPLDYYHSKLPLAKDYLKHRNIPFMIAQEHNFGFCDRSFPSTLPDVNSKEGKESRKQLHNHGYLKDNGHEVFRGSLTIPILNLNGEIENVYGRKISNKLRTGVPKHTYFHDKPTGLFNIKSILKHKSIILTGGVFESLSFITQGFDNTIACFGIDNFSDDHIQVFQDYHVNKIYLAFNNHSEVQSKLLLVADKFMDAGISVFLIILPSRYMDFNEFHKGKGDLKPLVDNSQAIGMKTIAPVDLDDIKYEFDGRVYRVRGLQNSLVKGALKINILVKRLELFHTDVFDLYLARSRKKFINDASDELLVSTDDIKKDVGKILFDLEGLQDELINKVLAPINPVVKLKEEEKKEAIEYLKSPNLVENIIKDFQSIGLIGEDVNSILGYLCSITRMFPKPISIIVQSQSSGGKSTVMDAIAEFIPNEDKFKVAKLTSQSLYYLPEGSLINKTIVLSEDEASTSSTYELKILLSEQKLSIASTGKDKTGRLTTENYEVAGPIQMMLSTTKDLINEELENRCIIISVKSDRKHTEEIHRIQRKQKTLDGLLSDTYNRDMIFKKHQNIQRVFNKELKVIIPFAENLSFMNTKLRNRRDHIKYLTLIEAIAFIHQFQREKKKVILHDQEIEYIEANSNDLKLANDLFNLVLEQSVSEIAPQTKLFLEKISELEKDRFTRKDIRNFTSWSNTQIHVHLKRLIDLEYVVCHKSAKGKLQEYELIEAFHKLEFTL